jgi:dihydropteroate synthase
MRPEKTRSISELDHEEHKLIYFNDKTSLRRVVRSLRTQMEHGALATTVDISSIFRYAGNSYILLKNKDKCVDNYLNSSDSAMQHLQLIPITHLNHNGIDLTQVYQWARAELDNSIEFIKLESMSHTVTCGRAIYDSKQREIIRSFEPIAEIMAIINYTPDSFSDGGLYNSIENLVKQINYQIEQGADILDIGVESTNPNSNAMKMSTEKAILSEIMPHIVAIKQHTPFRLSIDSYHPETIAWLLQHYNHQVDMINDVSGAIPTELVKEIIQSGKLYIAMHSLTVPAKKEQIIPLDQDPVERINTWIELKLSQFSNAQIDLSKIILDPGIGFGNNPAQAWHILRNLHKIHQSSSEILLGHSRKSFLSHINNPSIASRDIATAILGSKLINSVDYLRLHDVTTFRQVYPIFHEMRRIYSSSLRIDTLCL